MELWIIFSIGAAAISAIRQLISSNRHFHIPLLLFIWLLSLFAGLIQFGVWIGSGTAQISDINLHISLWSFIPGFIAGIVGNLLYVYSIRNGDFSLISSFTGMGILFSILLEGIIFDRFPTNAGLLGMVIILIGTIFLNISKVNKGVPQKKYIFIAIFAMLLWTIGDIIAKEASSGQNLSLFASFNRLLPAIFITPIVIGKYYKQIIPIIKSNFWIIALISILPAIQDLFRFFALSQTLVSYYTAIVKLQIFFAVILGHIFYKEKGYYHRLEASTIILSGIIIATIF